MTSASTNSSVLSSSEALILQHLYILSTFPNKREVLESFNKLKILSKGNNDNKAKIGINGGSATLLGLLNHRDIEIQREAVRLLRSISVNEQAQEQISRDRGIPLLLDLLRSTIDFSLNLGATAVLWNLSVSDENKRSIVKGGGIPLLINLIKTTDAKLQNEAVGCMRNLSMDAENKKILGREGVITHLISLLNSPEEKIQRNAALTLRNLSQTVKNQRRIEREKGIELLAKVLTEHNLDDTPLTAVVNPPLPIKFESTIHWDELSPYISKKVGEGKYGDVYKAKYHGFTVACKIIKKELTTEKDAEQILEELKFMQLLKHPNVVLLMGACLNHMNQIVIVTEYAEKGNLKDVLPEVKNLLNRLKFGLDIAQGLAWLHAHRIIHRDLKLANLLVSADNVIKISDFGLSLQYTDGVICPGFKGNVKYSPPEILRARLERSVAVYPYNERTDTYGFALIMWELMSMEPLFPTVRGKDDLTKHVLSGERPELKPHWPNSLKELLSLSWNEDVKKRPLFPQIVSCYDKIVTDMMCADEDGRKIISQLWKSKAKTNKVPFNDFQRVFTEILKPDFNFLKKTHIKCFQAALCDQFDDTVDFETFCKVLAWFGPVDPVNDFLQTIKEIISSTYFYGFLSLSKSINLVKTTWDSLKTKQVVFLYRFSNTDMGGFVLTYIDKFGEVHHKKIQRLRGVYHCEDPNLDCDSFIKLHKEFKQIYKLKKSVPGSPYYGLIYNRI